jgi:predicted HTH transcriptional regulator
MKPHYIHKLISLGENQHLDFKYEIADSRKIARTFSAFANTDGGKLLIGVMDNGLIAGIRTEEERFMAEAAVNRYCKPVIEYTGKEWIVEGKKVLEITIPPGKDKPYLAEESDGKWLAYVRVKDQNILASKVVFNAWKRKNRPQGVYIQYTEKEKNLLEYLENHPEISISEFMSLAVISRRTAENILSNFIALDIIEAVITEDRVSFRISEKYQDETNKREIGRNTLK